MPATMERSRIRALQARGRRFETCCAHQVRGLERFAEDRRGAKVGGDLVRGRAVRSLVWHRDAVGASELIPGGRAREYLFSPGHLGPVTGFAETGVAGQI
jgi:hypothetical protein